MCTQTDFYTQNNKVLAKNIDKYIYIYHTSVFGNAKLFNKMMCISFGVISPISNNDIYIFGFKINCKKISVERKLQNVCLAITIMA